MVQYTSSTDGWPGTSRQSYFIELKRKHVENRTCFRNTFSFRCLINYTSAWSFCKNFWLLQELCTVVQALGRVLDQRQHLSLNRWLSAGLGSTHFFQPKLRLPYFSYFPTILLERKKENCKQLNSLLQVWFQILPWWLKLKINSPQEDPSALTYNNLNQHTCLP